MTTQNNTFRPCVIHVGDNQALSAAVQRELFSRGYAWNCSRKAEYFHVAYSCIVCGSGDTPCCLMQGLRNDKNYPRFDAATQFGALLEYLDKPEEVKVPFGCECLATIEKDGAARLRTCIGTLLATMEASQIDAIYAASQAARKEGM